MKWASLGILMLILATGCASASSPPMPSMSSVSKTALPLPPVASEAPSQNLSEQQKRSQPSAPSANPSIAEKTISENPLKGAGQLTVIAGRFPDLEGAQWVSSDGSLLFIDVSANNIYKLTPPSHVTTFEPIGGLSVALDTHGQLLVAQSKTHRLIRLLSDNTTETLADNRSAGRPINPNDLVVKSDGTIYFTSLFGNDRNAVFKIGTDGSVGIAWQETHGVRPQNPNGIAYLRMKKLCTWAS